MLQVFCVLTSNDPYILGKRIF